MKEKHIWIRSFTINSNGDITNESSIILSPSLETLHLRLKATEEIIVNDALIKVSFTNKKARTTFYRNPISYDDKEYLMYKRSASSSRQGNVLFIKKDLYEEANEWSNCGLDLLNEENKNKISKNFLAFQAYRALTLSGCENFIHLNPKNILIIEDLYSTFNRLALLVSDKEPHSEVGLVENIKDKIYAYESFNSEIKNCIWDGQGFLDESVFIDPYFINANNQNKYQNNAMMILRNRFFKSCVFRTKLQKWFRRNGLSGEIRRGPDGMPLDINGYTEAKRYEDIQMVVTYSSLKYIKFFNNPIDAIKKWMAVADDVFGIVKTDKPTAYFGGDYVRTNYQLLNTIYMTPKQTLDFLEQNKKMIERVGTSSKAFIAYSSYCSRNTKDISEEREINVEKFFDSPFKENDNYFNPRFEVCCKLVELNSKFDNTSFYRVFVRNYVKQLVKNLEIGKVLVRGTYATIVSNPFEMLNYIVKKFDICPGEEGKPLMRGKIYSPFFNDRESILGSRSPHILPGNILVAENRHDWEIDEFFGFNRQIVCINSIGEMILHRLNGSDQDGDTILLTDNEHLLNAADIYEREYIREFGSASKFTVPVNCISPAAETDYIKRNKVDITRFAEADHKLSNNLIGSIVNLSQKYNSILWNVFITTYGNDPGKMKHLYKLYFLNSILEVLSNNEIDAAKGKTDFYAKDVVTWLEKYADSLYRNDPLFFVGVEEKKKQKEIDKKPEAKGKLAIGDDVVGGLLWSQRTTPNIKAISFNGTIFVYKPDKNSFKDYEEAKDLDIGDKVTLLFVYKPQKSGFSCQSVLITDEKELKKYKESIIEFKSVREALEFKDYRLDKLYLVKGKIRAFAHFRYAKYATTMDYVYECSQINPLAGQGRKYTKLTECYRAGEGVAPKNNCDEIAKKLIARLNVAEDIRLVLLKDIDKRDEKDLKLLQKANLNNTDTFMEYKEYLSSLAYFDGENFFSSKDRIKSLIRIIDRDDDTKTRKTFYLALYLMFNDEKAKYKELFEIDFDRNWLTYEDAQHLLFGDNKWEPLLN